MECWPSSGKTLAGFGVQGVLNHGVEDKGDTVLFWRQKAWPPTKDVKCRGKVGEYAGCSKERVSKKRALTSLGRTGKWRLRPDHTAPHLE